MIAQCSTIVNFIFESKSKRFIICMYMNWNEIIEQEEMIARIIAEQSVAVTSQQTQNNSSGVAASAGTNTTLQTSAILLRRSG